LKAKCEAGDAEQSELRERLERTQTRFAAEERHRLRLQVRQERNYQWRLTVNFPQKLVLLHCC
jgi:hypothetical protein